MILWMDPASVYRVRHNCRLSASLDPKDHFVYCIRESVYVMMIHVQEMLTLEVQPEQENLQN